ncbi:MAG TPA: LppX_LprAFG lipoprotein [Candidatus Dormibacteraeota bacterium]|nr:LppX_LprAFG lipoprotein [Candidatus Dormibacteraeota bacterium]
MRRIFGLVICGLLLAGCGGSPPPAPHVDAAQTLRQGAAAIAAVKTVKATLKVTHGTVSFQTFALASAKATVRMPDESDTTYTVKRQDLTFAIQVVITHGHVYLRLPFTTFTEAAAGQAAAIPDLARLFDASVGLPAVIPAGTTPRFVSTDQVDGVSAYQVTATYTPEQIHRMLSALSSAGDVKAKIWVDSSDHLIRRAILDGDFGDGGTAATVEVDLSGFDAAVVISSPAP